VDEPVSLRERKKAHTVRALLDVSARLFHTQGYTETTLEQICAEVEITVPTLLRYFPSKDQLALATYLRTLERFRAAIAEQRPDDVLTFWKRWVADEAKMMLGRSKRGLLAHRRMVESEPVLLAGALKVEHGYQDILAEALLREMPPGPAAELHSRLLAVLLTAGHDAAVRRWAAHDGELDLVRECEAVVDFAIARFPDVAATP
jgi:AcrR family transcriptional regulator